MITENRDNAEIHRFNQLADDWWNPQGPMKPLHQLNPFRLQFVQSHAALEDKSVLDVGCGGGILSESLAQQGAHVSALDLSPELIAVATEHATQQQLSIDYHLQPIEDFCQSHPQHFDVITCMEMLEHVPDPVSIINSCYQCLKPGGVLFLSTINRNAKAFLAGIVAAEYVLGLLPKGTHEYAKFIRPSELCRMTRNTGLEQLALQGLQYKPLSNSFELCDDLSINYLAAFKKNETN